MNAKKFSDAMSELDTKYVDEALNYKTKMKKPIWIKWGIMAACLCLIICVVTIPRPVCSLLYGRKDCDRLFRILCPVPVCPVPNAQKTFL
jgi:hypothetical protein